MLTVLGLVTYCLLLIFGVFLTCDFAGIGKTAKEHRTQAALICILFVVQIICWRVFGYDTTRKLYPLIVHLPLSVFLVVRYKITWIASLVCVFTAYLCCQTPRWFATVALYIFQSQEAYFICNALAIFPTFYLLVRYVVSPASRLMNVSKKSVLLFGILPFMYYVYDYSVTVYTTLLYSGIEIAVQFMPSTVSMCYFMFAILYYNEMQKRSIAETKSMLITVQMNQSKKEVEALQEIQQKTAIHRHDLHHHFALLGRYLEDGDTEKAIKYLYDANADIDRIITIRYCENNTVNLILSSFAVKAKEAGVTLSLDVNLPQNLGISETELCSLLSNALENSIRASSSIAEERFRTVRVNCQTHKGKLLILIENNFSGKITMVNGIPQSCNEGHGFGVKSMVMIAEKYNGYCSFTAADGVFTLKIVIPLEQYSEVVQV
ncbi:MAG: ATP-binding protein [Eubacteriales bacterium]|nr:ATP-binding protein [Eubacteriales bacterium]